MVIWNHLDYMKKIIISSLVLVSLSTGCQTMMYGRASDLDNLKLGMSKEEVLKVLGSPEFESVNGEAKEECLTYRKMEHVTGWLPHRYDVCLRDGKVYRWGEKAEK